MYTHSCSLTQPINRSISERESKINSERMTGRSTCRRTVPPLVKRPPFNGLHPLLLWLVQLSTRTPKAIAKARHKALVRRTQLCQWHLPPRKMLCVRRVIAVQIEQMRCQSSNVPTKVTQFDRSLKRVQDRYKKETKCVSNERYNHSQLPLTFGCGNT